MKRNVLTPFLALAAVIIDGVIKYIALKQPSFFQEGCFDSIACLSLHKNFGIAFSIPIPIWLTLIISALIIAVLIKLAINFWKEESNLALPTILILAGAVGNFIDRMLNGFTTDYLILFNLSAINISDILIVTGVLITLWYSFIKDMKKR